MTQNNQEKLEKIIKEIADKAECDFFEKGGVEVDLETHVAKAIASAILEAIELDESQIEFILSNYVIYGSGVNERTEIAQAIASAKGRVIRIK